MKRHLGIEFVACLAVLASCDAREMEATATGASANGLVEDTGGADLEQAIADLIDPTKLDIRLAPDGLEEIQAVEKTEIDADDVVAALSSIAPGETLVASSDGAERWEGSTQTFTASLDHEARLIDIGAEEERQIEPTETDGLDDAAVAETLHAFLLELGAREQELGEIDVRAFLSQARGEEDEWHGPIEMVGKAAFVSRQLGGIRVMGDRIHLTVTPQGELERVKGRWTPIDYAHSVLSAGITEEEVVDRAVSALAEAEIAADRAPEVVIRTAYRIVDDVGYGEIVVLKGIATAFYFPDPWDEDSAGGGRSVEFDVQ